MMFERESCTAAQMETAGICAEMRQAGSSFCIRQMFRRADNPPELVLATSSQGEMDRSNKPSCECLLP